MLILPGKYSSKLKPAQNFSQKISQPSSTTIICSANFIEFMESLWGLGILLQSYQNISVVLPHPEWKIFIDALYPDHEFTTIQLDNDEHEDHASELIVFLTNNVQKGIKSYLKKIENAVIAGMSSFSKIKLLNCIISVNELQSYYYQFFSFACQLTGKFQVWTNYISKTQIHKKDTSEMQPQSIYIDISPGIHGTRFYKNHIFKLVNALQKDASYPIILLDRDTKFYEKLTDKKFDKKPELQIINNTEQIFELLPSCKLFISANTPFWHCLRYTPVRTFSVLTPHERRHHFESERNSIFIECRFSALKIKNILPQIIEILY